MNVPAFTLDLGHIFVLIAAGAIGFVWMHLNTTIKAGDRSVADKNEAERLRILDRLKHLEATLQMHDTILSDVRSQLQQIQLQLSKIDSHLEQMSQNGPVRSKR